MVGRDGWLGWLVVGWLVVGLVGWLVALKALVMAKRVGYTNCSE